MLKKVLIVWALVAFLATCSLAVDFKGKKSPPLKGVQGDVITCTWLDTTRLSPLQTRTVHPAGVTLYSPAASHVVVRMNGDDVTAECTIPIPAGGYYTVSGPVAAIRVVAATDSVHVDRWLW